MQSTLNGASSTGARRFSEPSQLGMPPTLAAVPESIHWTKTLHERAVLARHDRISLAAYLMAEARGFEPGHDAEDWLSAQSQIDAIDSGSSDS